MGCIERECADAPFDVIMGLWLVDVIRGTEMLDDEDAPFVGAMLSG